jgi:pyruvate/2-oxoglutarate dehydrogenase complex dihydrolipoamide dehydrogenase (E3) component
LNVQGLASGKTSTFQTDMVVHAAGRVPEIKDLNLDAAGIEWEKRGVRVNEFLQSVSIPAVYAAGDAAASGGPPLAPVASYEGLIVATNLLKGNHQRPNYAGVPSVVFTIPPWLLSVSVNAGHVSKTSGSPSRRRRPRPGIRLGGLRKHIPATKCSWKKTRTAFWAPIF